MSPGCVSAESTSFTVNPQPPTPLPPSIGHITPPTCTVSTGSVILLGLPAAGWTVTRYPGTIETTGTGISDTITGLPGGYTYNFTVKNLNHVYHHLQLNVVIPSQPATPSPPVVGTITQPTFTVPTGSVALSGLPTSGSWILTRLPDAVTTAGSGIKFYCSRSGWRFILFHCNKLNRMRFRLVSRGKYINSCVLLM